MEIKDEILAFGQQKTQEDVSEEISGEVFDTQKIELENEQHDVKRISLEKEDKENILKDLNHFIQNGDYENVTPNLIKNKSKKLYKKIKAVFVDEYGDTDLMEIKNGIDAEFRDRFHFYRTRKSALYELRDLLREKRPTKITVRSLSKMSQELICSISRKNRNKKGYVDWPTIVSYWDKEFRDKFDLPLRYQEALPNEQYEDDEEVERVLQENTKYLYTFFHAESEEEQEKRNGICLSLIRLAKKGNKLAEKELMNFMTFLADKWLDEVKLLEVFKYNKDRRNDVIFRCIYNFKEEKSFVGYVFKTLKDVSKGFPRKREVGFFEDRKYGDEHNDGTNGEDPDDEYEYY